MLGFGYSTNIGGGGGTLKIPQTDRILIFGIPKRAPLVSETSMSALHRLRPFNHLASNDRNANMCK